VTLEGPALNVATFEVEADGASRSIVVEAEEERIRLGMGRSWRTYHSDLNRGSVDLDISVGGLPLRVSVVREGAIRLLMDGAEVEPASVRRLRKQGTPWGRSLNKIQTFTGCALFLGALAVFGLTVAEALGHRIAPVPLPLDRTLLVCVSLTLVWSARVAMGGKLSAFLLLNATTSDLCVRSGLYEEAVNRIKAMDRMPAWLTLPDASHWPGMDTPWLNLALVGLSTIFSLLLLFCMLRPSR
jgi:hypothetical protein